jgi:hypothetical protein
MTLAALSISEELFEERKRNRELSQQEDKVMQNVNKSLEKFLEDIKA